MLQSMNIALGMGHQAKDIATRIADTSDITDRTIGISRIGDDLVIVARFARVDKRYLSICLQASNITSQYKLPFTVGNGQFDGACHAFPLFHASCNSATPRSINSSSPSCMMKRSVFETVPRYVSFSMPLVRIYFSKAPNRSGAISTIKRDGDSLKRRTIFTASGCTSGSFACSVPTIEISGGCFLIETLLRSNVTPCKLASAISAQATANPPSERSWQASTSP